MQTVKTQIIYLQTVKTQIIIKNIEPDEFENINTEDVDVIDLSHIIYANRVDPDQDENCEDSDHYRSMHAKCLDPDHK